MMKRLGGMLLGLALATFAAPAFGEDAKIVLIAGRPSHGKGEHEFNAGMKLLTKCLKEVPGVNPVFVGGGWPSDESVFDGAKAVIFFMDGGGGHPMIQGDHLSKIKKLMDKGVGLGCMHYAVEIPKDKGGPELLDWIGGYYEDRFSTNPHWVAEIKSLPEHPITRGVAPFAVNDEWYYNMRFRPEMKDVTPILVAKPSDETRLGKSSSPRGPYKHIADAKGRDEILAWAVERPDGGRGFGFTGGHFHKNFGNADFRKLVLNAIVWTAKLDVPSTGIKSEVTPEELTKNLDPKR
jgi:type 1 glutamine amidotransferase